MKTIIDSEGTLSFYLHAEAWGVNVERDFLFNTPIEDSWIKDATWEELDEMSRTLSEEVSMWALKQSTRPYPEGVMFRGVFRKGQIKSRKVR